MRPFLLSLLLLSACTGNVETQSEASEPVAAVTQEGGTNAAFDKTIADRATLPPAPTATLSNIGGSAASLPVEVPANQMVIRNVNLQLAVAAPESAAVAITRIAEAQGGYVTESSQSRQGNALRAQLTLRIPAERLTETLEAIRKVAVRVEHENISAQDVTAEYTDLAARLKNLELAETELRELLTTTRERSQRASDILEVYNQLTHIRGEVERTKARIQYLSQMTAYSTFRIYLNQDAGTGPLVGTGWRPILAVREAGAQLVRTLQDGVELGIWLAVYVLPLLVLVGVPLYGLYRLLRQRLPRLRRTISSEVGS